MRILAIETSCDETALAIIETKKIGSEVNFKILGNDLSSQIDIHTQYGGVFPMMAKREHGKNIIHILEKVLREAKMYKLQKTSIYDKKMENKISKIINRENEIEDRWIKIMPFIKKPKIDAIAVTTGPGLEPALWVGISFAKALSTYWDVPIIPVNHMEGHIFSIFPKKGKTFIIDKKEKMFPMLSLLVSGGHTELILIKDWQKYKKIGQTRDDAAGEAFDKVARMLGLPYPGGPEISRLAKERRDILLGSLTQADEPSASKKSSKILLCADEKNIPSDGINFPRPMIHSKNYDFSFSGLKTAVLYYLRDNKISEKDKPKIAKEFEDAVIETLVHKTIKAIKEYKIKTLIVGGGVSANNYLREMMEEKNKKEKLKTKIHFPSKKLSTDNALMIAVAGYFQYKKGKKYGKLKANGNLSL